MKGKAITSDMGELLHAEIDITGNETLRIKSQCVIETSLTEEELNKQKNIYTQIENAGKDRFIATQVCSIPIKMLQKMMSKLKKDSDGEYWFKFERDAKCEEEQRASMPQKPISPIWVSTKDRLPEVNDEVIVLTKDRSICFGHLVDKAVAQDYDGWNIPDVEYWLPYTNPEYKQ